MIINNRLQQYLTHLGIISQHQYAGKKGVGSEDCIISFTSNVYEQLKQQYTVHDASFDSSDAFDSQQILIIYDKFKYHAGFDERGITMLKLLLIGRKSKCIIDGISSTIT